MKFLVQLALIAVATAQDGETYQAPAGGNCNSLVEAGGCVTGHRCGTATAYTPTAEEIAAALEAGIKAAADAAAEVEAATKAAAAEAEALAAAAKAEKARYDALSQEAKDAEAAAAQKVLDDKAEADKVAAEALAKTLEAELEAAKVAAQAELDRVAALTQE